MYCILFLHQRQRCRYGIHITLIYTNVSLFMHINFAQCIILLDHDDNTISHHMSLCIRLCVYILCICTYTTFYAKFWLQYMYALHMGRGIPLWCLISIRWQLVRTHLHIQLSTCDIYIYQLVAIVGGVVLSHWLIICWHGRSCQH